MGSGTEPAVARLVLSLSAPDLRFGRGSSVPGQPRVAEAVIKRRLLVAAVAGLFCGFTATPKYEPRAREHVSAPIALATQECWGKLKGKAQVEWYGHLRKIDETARAESVMTSTRSSVVQCVADAAGSHEPDPSIWPIVDAFVKHRFDYTR